MDISEIMKLRFKVRRKCYRGEDRVARTKRGRKISENLGKIMSIMQISSFKLS